MSGYIGVQPVPQATQRREYFTATSGQTTFNTNGYTPGYIDVFMNGVKLSPSDFTATNGSDVVLASGATTGDLLQVISFTPFNVANQTFVGNVNLSSGAYQIGGNTVIDSSRNVSAAAGTFTSTSYPAVTINRDAGSATTGDYTGLIINTATSGTAQSSMGSNIRFAVDDDLVAQVSGLKYNRLAFSVDDGNGTLTNRVLIKQSGSLDILDDDLQMGGTTVIDSSRNILAPNVTISASNSNEFTFTRSATSKTTLGFGTANQSIASTGPLSIKPDGTTINKYTFGSNDFVISGPNVAINNGSPELHFGTTSATHYNWRLAAQETLDAAFEIAVGSQDADYSDDTYSALVTVKNTGDVNITTGGLSVSSGTKTYRNEINNSSTAFSATGTLKIATALNGSGEGVIITSETRTSNDNGTSMFRLIDRAGSDSVRVNVDGTTYLNSGVNIGSNFSIVPDSTDLEFRGNGEELLAFNSNGALSGVNADPSNSSNTKRAAGAIYPKWVKPAYYLYLGSNQYWMKIYEVEYHGSSSFNYTMSLLDIFGVGTTNGNNCYTRLIVSTKQQGTGKYNRVHQYESRNFSGRAAYKYTSTGGTSGNGLLEIWVQMFSSYNECFVMPTSSMWTVASPGNQGARFPMESTGSTTQPSGSTLLTISSYDT